MSDTLIGGFHANGVACSSSDVFRFITTPLLLMDLLLTSGLPWPTILYTILIDLVMVVTGLIGALVHTSYKVRLQSTCCLSVPSSL